MISENPLDKKVFQDELDFKTLENILETLDHVTPKKVSRQEYNDLNGSFLVETGEDKFGKSYDLFLPNDLVYGELLFFIDFLSKKFGIENYTPYDRILTQTKIMVGVILRGGNSEEELINLAEKYNISDEFIKRILGQKINFGETRNTLRRIKYNGKTGSKEESLTLGFEELKDLFGEEFDLTFFRKGVNMLRLGMMTITKAEQENIKKGGIDDISVRFKVNDIGLDKSEKLLRDAIGIDRFKKELEVARKSGNQSKVNSIEMIATKRILEELYKYPYVYSGKLFGYKPNKIIKHKEIFCVGFALLGHAFLSELGIKHHGLTVGISHSAILVDIGGITYFFDPTRSKKLYEIVFGENIGKYQKFKINEEFFANAPKGSTKFELKCIKGKAEYVLLSHLYNNIATELPGTRSIKAGEKAISIYPSFWITYYNLGLEFYDIGFYNKSNLALNKTLDIFPNFGNGYKMKGKILRKIGKSKSSLFYMYAYHLLEGKQEPCNSKEKDKIKQLIDSQDFNGLRLYLLELEQEDN